MFKNLHELIAQMPDEKTCREYLAKQRWNGKPVCPHCSCDRVYVIEQGWRYKCGNSKCYKKFSVTVGTIFEASNIPLNKWFMAVYLCTAHKKGISSYQLGKDISVSQKSAWFMLHRIRELMRVKHHGKLDNIVEIDEVYIGGKVGNMSKTKRARLREEGITLKTKTLVMGMIERSGNLKLIALGKDNSAEIMKPVIREHIDMDAVVITDGHLSYEGLNTEYAAHEIVNHRDEEYVRDGVFHTNSIEGAFSHLKRSIFGIYHQTSVKHLSRYCDETAFRYNLRKMKDTERFVYSLKNSVGRLDYKTLVTPKEPVKRKRTAPIDGWKAPSTGSKVPRPVIQMKDGEIIAEYSSILEASKQTGIDRSNIIGTLKGRKDHAGGYQWTYAN